MNKYMNATALLRFIEKEMGYRFEDLEISPEEIIDNVQQESLPMFSKFYPYIVRHLVNPAKDIVDGYQNRYYIKLDDKYTPFGVNKVFVSNDLVTDDLMGVTIANTGSSYTAQLIADIISACRCPVTFQYFDDDDSFELYPNGISNYNILIEVKCIHLEDFTTIPFNLHDEFKKLALYDTQIALLPLRRRFSQLDTGLGNIELFISNLEEASSKRTELLENWRKNFFKSPKRKKIYIA